MVYILRRVLRWRASSRARRRPMEGQQPLLEVFLLHGVEWILVGRVVLEVRLLAAARWLRGMRAPHARATSICDLMSREPLLVEMIFEDLDDVLHF